MTSPAQDFGSRKLFANFRRRISFVGATPAGDPTARFVCSRAGAATASNFDNSILSFPTNTLRTTDRGIVIETAATQYMTNPSFRGAAVGGALPIGWNVTLGVTATVVSVASEAGFSAIEVDLAYTNTDSVASVSLRLNLEPGNGIAIPTTGTGRQFCFSGYVAVESMDGTQYPSVRLLGRDSTAQIVGDQGRVKLTTSTTATLFGTAPPIDDAAVTMVPCFTWDVLPNTVGIVRVKFYGLQVEQGASRTSFLDAYPATETRADSYPNSGLTGATVGSPGTLPTYWANSSMSSYRVLSVNSDGSIDIEVVKAAGASATTGTLRMSLATGSPPGAIAASPGEIWAGSAEALVLSNPQGATPRINLSARDAAGNTLLSAPSAEFSSVGMTRTESRFATSTPPPAGTTTLVLAIVISARATETSTVQLRIKLPKVEKITSIPGSGVVTRNLDVVSMVDPAPLAGPTTMMIGAELASLPSDGTIAAIGFGSGHTLRIVGGASVGVSVESGGSVVASALRTAAVEPGSLCIALTYQAGTISVGFPDAVGGGFQTLTVSGFNPASVTAAWLGSFNGAKPLTTAVRTLLLSSIIAAPANLPLLTRSGYTRRFFTQPVATTASPNIEAAARYAPTFIETLGAAATYGGGTPRKYLRRSNNGVAMTDTLPSPSSVGAREGSPYYFTVLNADASAPITFRCPGRVLYGFDTAAVSTYTLPPNRRVMFVADGYNLDTRNWSSSSFNWWFFESPNDFDTLSQSYEFLSIYGPADPANPNRTVIYPPWFAQYHSGIDPVRSFSTSVVQAMNNWLLTRSPIDASNAMRQLRDACAADYWKNSVNATSITTLPTQINSTGFAYLGTRDAGVGTPTDHAVIREWFRDRTEQTIAFYNSEFDSGFVIDGNSPTGVTWTGSGTGRNNHSYSASLAALLASVILDRVDFYDWGLAIFKRAIQDMQSVPGHKGALVQEMARGSKGLTYQVLAMSWLVPVAEILTVYGFDAYGYAGGALIEMINFTATAIDSPNDVRNEQTRMVGLGISGTNAPMIPSFQEPITYSGTDPNTGDPLPSESKVAWLYLAYRRLTTAQAPWRPTWTSRLKAYENVYSGSIGGAQSYLYRLPGFGVPIVLPPPSDVLDLSSWYLGLPTNADSELFYAPSSDVARSEALTLKSLSNYADDFFYTGQDENGNLEVNCVAPVFGSTTTPDTLSNHTRCELRGTIHGSGASTTEFRRNNQPRLELEAVVKKRPTSSGGVNICQIHGLSAFFLIVTLRPSGDLESGMTPPSGTGRTVVTLASGVQVGDVINIVMNWDTDDKIRYTVAINGGGPQTAVHATDPGWANLDCYFKAGAYHNTSPEQSDDYSKVSNGLLDPSQVTDSAWVAIRSLRQSLRAP